MITDGSSIVKFPKVQRMKTKISPLFTIFLVIFIIESSQQSSPEYLSFCSIRLEIRRFLNHTCDEVHRLQPMCKKPIRVSYSEFAPYIANDENGKASGLFPRKKTFVLVCQGKQNVLSRNQQILGRSYSTNIHHILTLKMICFLFLRKQCSYGVYFSFLLLIVIMPDQTSYLD